MILSVLTVTTAVSFATSTLVVVYSVWQGRRPTESVFARNARLDRRAAALHDDSPASE